MNILRIDASARAADQANESYRSISRLMADHFFGKLDAKGIEYTLIHRDVGKHPPSMLSEFWIESCFTKEDKRGYSHKQALLESDLLIDEVDKANLIVLSTPMYNYGMPATLKAWFDQVIRVNKTFDFDPARGESPLSPLLGGKSLIILWSCGEYGFREGENKAHMNHLTPHIRTASKYLGVEEIFEIQVEGQEFGDERHRQSRSEAIEKIESLIPLLF
ncbi:hypothetical protein EZI54_15250 [Marinobacter halodurans]|uniref:FMN dependent NADH:quinone oxidoreductase n=2 Tax=Marinobacter halodurans TaxID=2528979 RepID=A0ABY1ZKB1_9GAMM|nr:hypothetical protein EZI54_15250 [Marinobacter halodurans]